MAHHECNRCGRVASKTREFCDACTPREVLDAAAALVDAEEQAGYRFDKSVAARRKAYIRDVTIKQRNILTRAKRAHKLKTEL